MVSQKKEEKKKISYKNKSYEYFNQNIESNFK